MPKATKPKKATASPRSLYVAQPWKCRHLKDHSEILVYVEASGAWETMGLVQPTGGASAETAAEFITQLINTSQQNQSALRDAMEALELCLEEDGLTFSSEQVAERSLNAIKKLVSV